MSVKITLQILGSLASAGTVTTGLVFGAPKLKTALNLNASDDSSTKSLDGISNVATDSTSIVSEHKNNPPQPLFQQ